MGAFRVNSSSFDDHFVARLDLDSLPVFIQHVGGALKDIQGDLLLMPVDRKGLGAAGVEGVWPTVLLSDIGEYFRPLLEEPFIMAQLWTTHPREPFIIVTEMWKSSEWCIC